jgi:hypothetical protein
VLLVNWGRVVALALNFLVNPPAGVDGWCGKLG